MAKKRSIEEVETSNNSDGVQPKKKKTKKKKTTREEKDDPSETNQGNEKEIAKSDEKSSSEVKHNKTRFQVKN